jgi:1,4-alpha-glucan branching enzyme
MHVLPITSTEVYLFNEGSHCRSYQVLGAHLTVEAGTPGVRFAVWAPNASQIRVVGDFNGWQGSDHQMSRVESSGIWQLFVPGIGEGILYKYEITGPDGQVFLRADPYAFWAECPPATASKVCRLSGYEWGDGEWQAAKGEGLYRKPTLIYEVHLGSWRRKPTGEVLTYRELAEELVEYAADMGYTHIELLPVMEHPFGGSWGYQSTGYFAATSRYGTPQDFMYFIDRCHQRGLGVIVDWVPGHFCKDCHGLWRFDGTALYESGWPERGENRQWGTANFDFGRREVWSFLISNAIFWLDAYHIDGLRVDAVANMLYLDYGKQEGEWIPNYYGGNGNLDAIEFLKKLNMAVFKHYPATLMIAEESTSWPMVTWPVDVGGLGFNFKWNMGWMNDMLRYMSMEPVHRKWSHNLITFSFMYAFSENFVLPLSHDEVVHGKKSLLDKMPGDYWQKFANLRLLYGYMMAHPGKKLLFMGGEFGQFIEWNYEQSLDWHLLDYELHAKLHDYVGQLNRLYKQEPSLWQLDYGWQGFAWIDPHDYSQSVISFMRKAEDADDFLVIVCNFTPVVRDDYRIGVPRQGVYEEIFNSDWAVFGGSDQKNGAAIATDALAWHNQPLSIKLRLPPLGVVYLRWKADNECNITSGG